MRGIPTGPWWKPEAPTKRPLHSFLLIALLGITFGCAQVPVSDQQVYLTPVGFEQLAGWRDDHPAPAFAAFRKSCKALLKKSSATRIGPRGIGGAAGDWHPICRAMGGVETNNDSAARRFFEKWFSPFEVAGGKQITDGLFTGYYEPELRGAKIRGGRYQVPLYGRPLDLVTVDLGRFDAAMAGRTLTGRLDRGKLMPYPTRASIESSLATLKARPLVWVDSPVDAFFLQIQGSGRIRLTDGSVLRLGYAASNGRAYTAIGRILVARGHIARDRVSMQSIRAWLAGNSRAAAGVMAENDRFVFFRPIAGDGPIGAQGVALTAGRSLAIDRRLLPLGVPLWVDTRDPIDPGVAFRRLMIAQDTGGAIKGAIRGDIFFGHGRLAARRAGLMNQKGRYFILLPRSRARPS